MIMLQTSRVNDNVTALIGYISYILDTHKFKYKALVRLSVVYLTGFNKGLLLTGHGCFTEVYFK